MNAIIIGGGICGLTTALGLERLGIQATVYEAAPALKPVGAGLVLAPNAIRALDYLGVKAPVVERGHLIPAVQVITNRGRLLGAPLTKRLIRQFGASTFAIHRAELQAVLLGQLRTTTVVTGKRVQRVSQSAEAVTVYFEDGTEATADVLLAADGIHSAVRRQLVPAARQRYAGYTCWRGVVQPHAGQHIIPSEAWGLGSRFGMVPLADNRVYWYACLNAPARDPQVAQYGPTEVAQHFRDYLPPTAGLIGNTDTQALIHGDIIDLEPIRQFAFGRVLLMGDAAHATTPNLGQGACQAIEDAAVLTSLLQKGQEPEAVFRQFEKQRLPRTTRVVQDSWRLGQLSQLENRWAIAGRNALMRLLPTRMQEQQLAFLYDVKF